MGTFFYVVWRPSSTVTHTGNFALSLFCSGTDSLTLISLFFHSKNLSLSLIPIFEFYIFFSLPKSLIHLSQEPLFAMAKSELVCSH